MNELQNNILNTNKILRIKYFQPKKSSCSCNNIFFQNFASWGITGVAKATMAKPAALAGDCGNKNTKIELRGFAQLE